MIIREWAVEIARQSIGWTHLLVPIVVAYTLGHTDGQHFRQRYLDLRRGPSGA